MRSLLFAGVFSLAQANALAQTLTTESFTVAITVNCEEGEVTCDDVSYVGVSKKTGKSISLTGKTLHTSCKDGAPCRFLGYEFKSGKIVYRVLEDGRLLVSDSDKILVDEIGEWTY